MKYTRKQSRMIRRNTTLPPSRQIRELSQIARSVMRLWSAAFLGLFLAIGLARSADAQEEEIYCGMCVTEEAGATHWAQNSWMPEGWYGAVDEDGNVTEDGAKETGFHISKNLSGSCKEKHKECPGEIFAALTDAVIDAASRSDVAALASLVNDPAVSVFAARSAIQVASCNPDLVAAHVPVNEGFLQSVQLAAAKLSDRSDVADNPGLRR